MAKAEHLREEKSKPGAFRIYVSRATRSQPVILGETSYRWTHGNRKINKWLLGKLKAMVSLFLHVPERFNMALLLPLTLNS